MNFAGTTAAGALESPGDLGIEYEIEEWGEKQLSERTRKVTIK